MRPDHSDMQIYEDLTDLNRGFLGLLTEPGAGRAVPGLGLDSAIVDQLRRLSPEEMEFIAGTPGLLACFARVPLTLLHQVAEMPITRPPTEPGWRESARLYVTGLLTYMWQTEQHGWPACTLCTGAVEKEPGSLAVLDFARIRASADLAVDQLRARFAAHPVFWADLIRSARSGNEDFQTLSQLTIIPLVLAEECSAG